VRVASGRIRQACVAAALLLAVACGSALSPTTPILPSPSPTPPPAPRVVIASVDGLRPDSLSIERTPNILDLAAHGTACWQASTTFPPITLPSHASMLTGYTPAVHGLIWADYLPAKGLSKVPTIFSYARAAGLRTVMVVGKEKFRHLNLPDSVDAFDLVMGDDDIVNQAIVELQAGADLMFVHLPNVDVCGHANGWMSAKYLDQVQQADRAVGRLRAALPAEVTLILTADHGGLGSTHGVDRSTDMLIPWIIEGPDVIENHVLARRITTVDTAATALQILGLHLAADAPGRPVLDAFRAGSAASRERPVPMAASH
jgi:arylsulfatase A-like enzyme